MAQPVPIAPVLEHYGATYVPERHRWTAMRCPFHEDRSASASVNTEKQAFKCFACDIKGDAYSIVMNREGTDFVGARQFLEELLGDEYGDLFKDAIGRKPPAQRRSVFEESGPHQRQRSLFPIGVRRKPLDGA